MTPLEDHVTRRLAELAETAPLERDWPERVADARHVRTRHVRGLLASGVAAVTVLAVVLGAVALARPSSHSPATGSETATTAPVTASGYSLYVSPTLTLRVPDGWTVQQQAPADACSIQGRHIYLGAPPPNAGYDPTPGPQPPQEVCDADGPWLWVATGSTEDWTASPTVLPGGVLGAARGEWPFLTSTTRFRSVALTADGDTVVYAAAADLDQLDQAVHAIVTFHPPAKSPLPQTPLTLSLVSTNTAEGGLHAQHLTAGQGGDLLKRIQSLPQINADEATPCAPSWTRTAAGDFSGNWAVTLLLGDGEHSAAIGVGGSSCPYVVSSTGQAYSASGDKSLVEDLRRFSTGAGD